MPKGIFPRKKKSAVLRFWTKVSKKGPNDCWLWIAAGSHSSKGCGYGYFWDGFRQIGAHCYSLQVKLKRTLRDNEWALHKCDTKLCVNPKHLFLGNADTNSKDMVQKGRKEKGEAVAGAKLTAQQVVRLRQRYAAGEGTRKLAKQYEITCGNVYVIMRGESWRHIGGPIGTRPRGATAGVKQPWAHRGGSRNK